MQKWKGSKKIKDSGEMEESKEMKERKKLLGVREFFRGKSGRNFLLFLEALLVVAFLLNPDLYYDGQVENIWDRFYADSLTICGGLWVILVFLTVSNGKLSEHWNRIWTTLCLPFVPLIAFFWLEFYGHMQFWQPLWEIPLLYIVLDLIIYYVVFFVLLFLYNNVRNASIAMIVLTSAFGIANYELTMFRGMPFIASDIYSFVTAISVANTYQLQVDVDTAEFFMLTLVLLALLLKLKKRKLFSWKKRGLYGLGCVAMVGAFIYGYVTSSFLEDVGVDFRVYRPQNKYRYYGTMLTTMRTFGYLHVVEPENYSEEAVQAVIDAFYERQKEKEETTEQSQSDTADTSQQKPNIIAIMNESFADLKAVGKLECSEDCMPYFHSLTENTIKGYTYSSVFGGNTANSEFEFLTGNTLGFLPDNSVPYQLFLRNSVSGVTANLKSQGYSPAYALHPYYKTGYSRYKVYPLMGFDQFFTSDHFSVFTDTVNYHITDQADYEKLIALYENAKKKSDDPFYIFNVTMQNHGSYTGSLYETGNEVKPSGRLCLYPKATQYLNMLRMSDNALKYLIQYFEQVDEPTVILFFGDHQPDLDESFYDYLLNTNVSTLDGEELEQLYKVPFLIWANYDIEEKTVDKTSNNYLSTYLNEVTGVKTSGYEKFLAELREEIPAINALGYWDKNGKWYSIDDETSPYYSRIEEYHLLEYNNLFGGKNRIASFFEVED